MTALPAALHRSESTADPLPERDVLRGFQVQTLYAKGTQLFAQGASLHDVYWLEKGLVKLVYLDEDGRERILDLRAAQRLIGAAAVLLRLPSPLSAVTVTVCQMRRIPAAEFIKNIESGPRTSRDVLYLQSQELYGQFERIADLSTGSSRLRLERFLRGLVTAAVLPGGTELEIPLKRCELAQLLAITPEHLSRLFRQLCETGVIGFAKGRLLVHDVDRLAGASDHSACGDMLRKNRVCL